MGSLNLDDITTRFYSAGVHYSAAFQPYAIKLFFALFLIDIIVTWIQYTAEGQLGPSYFVGRMLKHVLTGALVYLMIVNGFSWMYLVIQSLSRIGAAISGLPALSPQSVLGAGINMTETLVNSPINNGISSFGLSLVEFFYVVVVNAAFVLVAVELLLTLVKAYLTTGLGVILVGFGGNRFTASASEGYLTNVIRIGVKVLSFYAVLAIGMQMVTQWGAALEALCKAVVMAASLITSYYVPPSKTMTTVCSGTISTGIMVSYAAFAAVFAIVTVAVPTMAADLAGGMVGLSLVHTFEAAYAAQTIARIVNPITGAIKKVSNGVASRGSSKGNAVSDEKSRDPEHTRTASASNQRRCCSECRCHSTESNQRFEGREIGDN